MTPTTRTDFAAVNRIGVIAFTTDSPDTAAAWIRAQDGRRGDLHVEEIVTTVTVRRRRVAVLRSVA